MKFFRSFFRRLAVLSGAAAILVFGAVGYYQKEIPDSFYVEEGKEFVLSAHQSVQERGVLTYDKVSTANRSRDAGQTVDLKLWGLVPIKSTHLSTVDCPVVVPGGTAFGIKLFTEGVMVVDVSSIETAEGLSCPAKDAGIQKGDVILKVGGQPVSSNEQIAGIIGCSEGKSLSVELERDGETRTVALIPARASADGKYKSGIWVRDSSAGIGTVTYYMPDTGLFAGLGHGICDVDTGKLMPLHQGEVCPVTINSIRKGQAGAPGELKGSFTSNQACGQVYLNNEAGVFGKLDSAPNNFSAVPIKFKQDVTVGDATILCTLDDGAPSQYSIHIDRVDLNPNTLTKNMMITVTDPALLSRTGGIVQGMSGSPILQDGKLIGAVTHVFVNNSTKGYGIFAENMIEYNKNCLSLSGS